MVRVGCMTYFRDHKWYDELADGVLKEEALVYKARFKESWGDATPEVMKFYAWNYEANNAGDTQDSPKDKKEHKGKKSIHCLLNPLMIHQSAMLEDSR
ncbi:hypothetical protein Tco_0388971 [Tanacetum coccineum]